MTDELARISPAVAVRRHEWLKLGIESIAAVNSDNRCSQTIRTCSFCGIKRVTMHPLTGNPWWEFMLPDAPTMRVRMTKNPECKPVEKEP